jgi:hypothetical protein
MFAGTVTTIPPGLSPGDQYHLIFLTSGTRDATSSNIADYDAFVTDQANLSPVLAALGTTWRALGSTGTANAIDNRTSQGQTQFPPEGA